MMARYLAVLGIAVAALTNPVQAETQESADPHTVAMLAAVRSGNPQKAVSEADAVISSYQARYNKSDMLYYCSSSPAEALANMATAAALKKSAVSLSSEWCDAYFVKGFALIDLHRSDLAEPELRRATEMAPFNAHYLNEYAELFKARREWQKSHDLFAKALDIAGMAPEASRNQYKARALRGMGFNKIELGKLDEAETLFRRSLEFQPNYPGALTELEYIARLKATMQ